MNIFIALEDQAAAELMEQAEQLPIQMSVMDVARFLGVSKTTAYKLAHSEGFPSIQFPGFKRLIVPKKLFLEWFAKSFQKMGYDPGAIQDALQAAVPGGKARTVLAGKEQTCYDSGV